MEKYILENGKKFFIHPVYKKYAANEDGEIMNIRLGRPKKGNLKKNGYLSFTMYIKKNRTKTYACHRFVFECFYGLIEEDKQINHINFIRNDNRLTNLEVVTASENSIKSAKKRKFNSYRNNPKKVTAINLFSNVETNFNSFYSVYKMLGINPAQVRMICEGINYCKSANSKVDGQKYFFKYQD